MRPYPILLEPILKPRVWGGRRLASLLHRNVPPGVAIGESWEIADLPERIEAGRSVIANGALRGRTLHEAIAAHRSSMLGDAQPTRDGGFPLLVKYLDAAENLSVQVHPPEAYVRAHPGTDVKDEAWIVIDAAPDAVIYRGVRPGVTAAQFAAHVHDGTVVDDLVRVPARVGDCHYLPSGTCHALGAGLLVAEVQTPSDTTFRVYDWGRTGRELHLEPALECIEFSVPAVTPPPTRQSAPPFQVRSPRDPRPQEPPPAEPIQVDGLRTTPLLRTPHFELERLDVGGEEELPVVTDNQPVVWMITSGSGVLRSGAEDVALRAGTTVLLPAALEGAVGHLARGCTLIRIALPSPAAGLIA